MKRTTTWVFGSPARPTLRPERYWLWLIAACQRVSLQASPEHTGNQCASNRMIRNISLGSAVATGAFFILLSLISSPTLAKGVNTNVPEDTNGEQKLSTERINSCRFQANAGPEMVIIAAGQFQQGSDASEIGYYEDEAPKHPVTLAKPFALGRCEVTVAEFRLFVKQTGHKTDAEKSGGCNIWNRDSKEYEKSVDANWKQTGFKQDENHPVVCVSWNDTQAYINWLNAYLALPEDSYRLVTESEWEYVARAGTTSAYFWGAQSQCGYANGADQALKKEGISDDLLSYADCDDNHAYTATVASFKANPWGLYDMSGNVWEWVQDCWHNSYKNAPKDGRAWLEEGEGDCTQRSVRGGGWYNEPRILRSASRHRYSASEAINDMGFRLARTL